MFVSKCGEVTLLTLPALLNGQLLSVGKTNQIAVATGRMRVSGQWA